jgi:hypothetical protein
LIPRPRAPLGLPSLVAPFSNAVLAPCSQSLASYHTGNAGEAAGHAVGAGRAGSVCASAGRWWQWHGTCSALRGDDGARATAPGTANAFILCRCTRGLGPAVCLRRVARLANSYCPSVVLIRRSLSARAGHWQRASAWQRPRTGTVRGRVGGWRGQRARGRDKQGY